MNVFSLLITLFFLSFSTLIAKPYPITFAIPECKIVDKIPEKDLDFAPLIPGKLDTYKYTEEEEYYRDYRRSYFAITQKKGGWDCLRHYEILACGCIPYFLDLESCNEDTLYFFPKQLVKEAMNLKGVHRGYIDFDIFDEARYSEILEELLQYTREHLTTKQMGKYILRTAGYSGTGKVLYLSNSIWPDYMRCTMLIGLKEALGTDVIDVPKIPHIYTSYPQVRHLYGRGFSYTKILPDDQVDRENIEKRIKNKEFELIIYGSVHRGLPHYNLVLENYPQDKIFYICGEDAHNCEFLTLPNLFLREFN